MEPPSVRSPLRKKIVRFQDPPSSLKQTTTATKAPTSPRSVNFDQLNYHDCLESTREGNANTRRCDVRGRPEHNKVPTAKKLKEMKRELSHLEQKIQRAAKVELEYLNEAKKCGEKRNDWVRISHKLEGRLEQQQQQQQQARANAVTTTGSCSSIQIEEMKLQISHIEAKVKKATKMEAVYLKKSKELRGKRYRWTQLFEHTRRELEALKGPCAEKITRRLNKQLPPLMATPSSARRVTVDAS